MTPNPKSIIVDFKMFIQADNDPQVDPELTPAEIGARAYDAGQEPPTCPNARRAYMSRPSDYGQKSQQAFNFGRYAYECGTEMREMNGHNERMGWLVASLEAAGK